MLIGYSDLFTGHTMSTAYILIWNLHIQCTEQPRVLPLVSIMFSLHKELSIFIGVSSLYLMQNWSACGNSLIETSNGSTTWTLWIVNYLWKLIGNWWRYLKRTMEPMILMVLCIGTVLPSHSRYSFLMERYHYLYRHHHSLSAACAALLQ